MALDGMACIFMSPNMNSFPQGVVKAVTTENPHIEGLTELNLWCWIYVRKRGNLVAFSTISQTSGTGNRNKS